MEINKPSLEMNKKISHSSSPTKAISGNSWERNIMKTAKGGGTVFIGRVFKYAIRFIIGLFLARLLGAHQYGQYTLVLTTITLVTSFTYLGLKSGVVRYVSVFLNKKDDNRLWGVIQLGLIIPTVLGILACVGIFVFADRIASTIFDNIALAPLLRLASLAIPFLIFVELVA